MYKKRIGKLCKKVSLALSILLSLTLVMPIANAAEAEPLNTAVVFNEYDLYVSLQSCTDNELTEQGYLAEDIALIRANLIEEKLLERAALSEETLCAYGYTLDEVALLKEINESGKVTLTETELRGLTGTCTGNISATTASASEFRISYNWKWDHAPIVCYKDSVAVRWEAHDAYGVVDSYAGYLTNSIVNYYDTMGNLDDCIMLQPIKGLEFNTVQFNINMSYENLDYVALDGMVSVQILKNASQARDFEYVKVSAIYGHTILNIGFPSLSIDKGGIGIGFSGGLNTDNVGGDMCMIDIHKRKTQIKG